MRGSDDDSNLTICEDVVNAAHENERCEASPIIPITSAMRERDAASLNICAVCSHAQPRSVQKSQKGAEHQRDQYIHKVIMILRHLIVRHGKSGAIASNIQS